MSIVYNPLTTEFRGKSGGKWHSIPAGKWKRFIDSVGESLADLHSSSGLVLLPQEFEEKIDEDPTYITSNEAKQILLEKKKEGINKRVAHLRRCVYNEEVSLKRDLEQANRKEGVHTYANDKTVAIYEELASYQVEQNDEEQQKVKKLQELSKKIKKSGG